MKRRLLQATFDNEDDTLSAVTALRRKGLALWDIYTPYAVHGLDEAAGLRPTRIGWVCAICGLLGAAFALAFQEWVSVKSWALNIGGKPFDSLPAFVPVVFEVGVLLGGLSVVFALFVILRLYPGKKADLPLDAVTDDRFVVQLDASQPDFEAAVAQSVLTGHGALEITEQMIAGDAKGAFS